MISIIELPESMKRLPVERDFPVPWFVQWFYPDGKPAETKARGAKPDFRVMSGMRRVEAINRRLCWICGERLQATFMFVAGPACTISRIFPEPQFVHS